MLFQNRRVEIDYARAKHIVFKSFYRFVMTMEYMPESIFHISLIPFFITFFEVSEQQFRTICFFD